MATAEDVKMSRILDSDRRCARVPAVASALGASKVARAATSDFDQSSLATIAEIDPMSSIKGNIAKSFLARLAEMNADGARVAAR
jgi:hypothetical protein